MSGKFDCFKCHHKCKAACCGVSPIEKEIYQRNLDKRLRPVIKESDMEPCVIPMTEDSKCTFLKENFTCNIYDDRPTLCKKFGDETHAMMTCLFQDKNGRERSRQERRSLERKLDNSQTHAIERLLNIFPS
jgi:Fe-S-cluster containining protein